MMKPSIGRIVHYTNLGDKDGKYPPEIQAAMITKLGENNRVTLKIFYPTGIFDREDVEFTTEAAGIDEARGKWAWPERV